MRLIAAYQGRPGAYSELAARQFLGGAAGTLPCMSFADILHALRDGRATHGVLPIHNTLAGVIAASCRLLATGDVRVEDELRLPIAHALLAAPGSTLETIREVRSHPVALAQCRNFLRRHPAMKIVIDDDTAGAVETLMRHSLAGVAAIAGAHAAAIHGAEVLASNLEDCAENRTCFVLVRAARLAARNSRS